MKTVRLICALLWKEMILMDVFLMSRRADIQTEAVAEEEG
jgi:hypothetical protein